MMSQSELSNRQVDTGGTEGCHTALPRSGFVQREICSRSHISRFCDLYREFERRLSPMMRQHHVAGDKLFVDYAGKTIGIVDPATGEVHDAEIFVAALGRLQLHLRRSDLDADAARLDRRACRAVRGSLAACRRWSCPTISRPASPSRRFYEPGDQPHLRRTGGALRHGRCCRRGRRSRATRRLLHTAPCSDVGAVIGTRRAGRAPRPPQPLRMVWLHGSCPQATIQIVTVALRDQPLTPPLVHGRLGDAEPRSDLARREHAAAAQPLISA